MFLFFSLFLLCIYQIIMPLFKRFVEVGRLALVNYGPDEGKVAVIVDVLDHNRALIDGPTTGVARQSINFKRISLTGFKVKIPHSIKSRGLKKALTTSDVINKWKSSAWAQKLEVRAKRQSLTDFDRFKLVVLRKRRRAIVTREVATLRKQNKKK